MAGMRAKLAARLAALGAATLGLSACYYDAGIGLGYYDDGYNYGGYYCDPFSPFDIYYDCDYRRGFYNIGYGGGWYQDYWYPGHGFFIFDRFGRRYDMYDHHRRYWGQRRYDWYRHHHHRRGYRHGWGHNDGYRRDGYHHGGQYGTHPNQAVVNPPAVVNPDELGWRGPRREGRGERRRNWQGDGGNAVPAPAPIMEQPDGSAPYIPGNGRRDWQGDTSNWQPPAQQLTQAAPPPAVEPRPQSRAERILRGEPRVSPGDQPQRQED